jgi:hypothetical protein
MKEVIFYKDRLDLQRVQNDSFDKVYFDMTDDIGIFNCLFVTDHCDFCITRWCYSCMNGYQLEFDSNTCIKTVAGCNYITGECSSKNEEIDNFENYINLIVDLLSYNSSFHFVNLIFYFDQPKDLSKPLTENPNDVRTFYMHFNSLESTLCNPLTKRTSTGKKFKENTQLLSIILHKASMLALMFGQNQVRTYVNVQIGDKYGLTESLALYEDNRCFLNSCHTYISNSNYYTCSCPRYGYMNGRIFIRCADNCLLCWQNTCEICDDGYILDNENRCVRSSESEHDILFNQMLLSRTEYNWNMYLDSLQRATCSAGFIQIGDYCEPCSSGCLICAPNKNCVKCDANYKLGGEQKCILVEYTTSKANMTFSLESRCDDCFQTQKNTPIECKQCRNECKCSLKSFAKQNSYLFNCLNVTFSPPFPEVKDKQSEYAYENAADRNSIILVTKLKTNLFRHSVDTGLIFDTSSCLLNTTREYSIATMTKMENKVASNETTTGQTATFFSSNDIIILTLTLISGPFGNIVIGLLQFNKIFAFLSLSNEKGGQFFEFINVNLYKSKKPDGGFWVGKKQLYEYLTEFEKRDGDKMVSKFTTFMFVGLLASQQLLFVVAYIMSKFKDNPKVQVYKNSVIQFSFKVLRAASYRYNNLFVSNMSFLITGVNLVDTKFHKGLYIVMLLFILYFPTSLYNKALSYLKSEKHKVNGKYSFFNSLSSPMEWQLNQQLLYNRLYDEAFVIAKAFLLYESRDYSKCLMYTALVLTVAEFICVFFFYKTIKKSFTAVKLLGILQFALFIFLMLMRSYGFKIPDLIFEIAYLTSNLSKLIEVLLSSLFVLLMNREYSNTLKRTQQELEVVNVC